MSSTHSARPLGQVFDTMAAEYDRYRPTYPDQLVDWACTDLVTGDPVLEVGCGTGQLTCSLAARGLRVTAVEPGSRLIALAEEQADGVHFVNAPFETAELSDRKFRAVFSASAFHWVDPDISWARAAGALSPGGRLALLQYCSVRAHDDQDAILEVMARVAPELIAGWPSLRPLDVMMTGIQEIGDNVSEVWSWVGNYDLSRPAGLLFEDVRAAAVPVVMEHTAAELVPLLSTLSSHGRLSTPQQATLEASIVALEEEVGRPIRSTTAAVLVTARRTSG